MEGHFGECFNEDVVLRIASQSFVDAGAAPGGPAPPNLVQAHTRTHTHTQRGRGAESPDSAAYRPHAALHSEISGGFSYLLGEKVLNYSVMRVK